MRARVVPTATVLLSLLTPLAAADALPDRSDYEGHAAGFTASAPIPGPLLWTAEGLPPGVRMGPTGEVSGVLPYDAAGTYAVTLAATGPTATWQGTFTWVVRDVNRPPSVAAPGLVTGRVGVPVALQLAASDPDGDALRYAATGLPAGLALDPETGLVRGTPTAAGLSLVDVVITDTGHATAISVRFAFPWWVEGPRNRAPDCAAAAPTVATLWPPNGRLVPVGVAGLADPDGDALAVTVTGISSDEAAATGGVGTPLALLPAARDGAGDGREYEVRFAASDGKGGACSGAVRVRVPHDQA